jgi:hypothetical protein
VEEAFSEVRGSNLRPSAPSDGEHGRGLAPRVPPAPDVATNAARKPGKRLRLYIAGLFKNSGSHPLAGARPHEPGLWTLTPGKNRCPKLLTPERLATPTAARELFCVSLASLVILEEQPSVFPADPPELPPDRCPMPTRTTQRRHKPEPPAHLCTLGDKNIRAGEAAPARSSDRQPVRQAPVVPQRRCLGLVVYLCVHRSLPPTRGTTACFVS